MSFAFEVYNLNASDTCTALSEVFEWVDPQILGYHHPSFQHLLTSLLSDELRSLAVRSSAGRVIGLFPFRQKYGPYGYVINCLPFFGCNSLLAVRKDGGADITRSLLMAFRELARGDDVFSAALYTPFGVDSDVWAGALRPDEQVTKFTQFLPLNDTGPTWPTKRRGDLRRARERGFLVRPAAKDDTTRIWDIYSEGCRAAGIPTKPFEFVSGTVDISVQMAANSPMQWRVATLGGTVVAALLFGRSRLTGSYILPCSDPSVRSSQPNVLLMDTAIRESWELGMRYWNFESSPEWGDAVFKFKQRWGSSVTPFKILVFYGKKGARPTRQDISSMREVAPYYFVAPVGRPTGLWPRDGIEVTA